MPLNASQPGKELTAADLYGVERDVRCCLSLSRHGATPHFSPLKKSTIALAPFGPSPRGG
jgi:hypothetical protein